MLAEWERGATIVLQGLHLHRPELGAFCRSLERTLGHPTQVNAYYTPRSAQGLPVHHDTHDVFVLQVSGEKRWLVYEPAFELPLRNQKYSAEMGGPGEPVHDLVLGPGDTLYLPRGWLHEALTSDSDSLHLTVGVNVVTWLDAFKAALDECGDELGFRRSIAEGDADELVEALRGRLIRRRGRATRGRKARPDAAPDPRRPAVPAASARRPRCRNRGRAAGDGTRPLLRAQRIVRTDIRRQGRGAPGPRAGGDLVGARARGAVHGRRPPGRARRREPARARPPSCPRGPAQNQRGIAT